MKSIKTNSEDSLRPEYKRSDLGELVRGTHATTQVDFHQLTGVLLTCICEDEGMEFKHQAIGNYLAQHRPGDWTYEIDNGNQITLRYWLSEFGSIEETIANPPAVMTPTDRTELQDALNKGVASLKAKAAALKDQPKNGVDTPE